MMKRRDFLEWSGLALAGAALPGGAWAAGSAEGQETNHTLVQLTGRPQNLATPIEFFDRAITPTDVFFVRSHFGPPAFNAKRRLRVGGMVAHALDLGRDDLKGFEEVTITCVLQCAGNGRSLHRPRVPGVQWGHGAMGQAQFTGVRLADVLKKAEIQSGAAHVQIAGADLPPKPMVPRFVRSIPLERAMDPTTLIAHSMNGEPLTLAHGAPLRLVVPGWTGNHWIKWLSEVNVQKDEQDGFYMQTGYRYPKQPVQPGQAVPPDQTMPLSVMPIKSIIGRPSQGASIKVGPQEVVGVAFSGAAAVKRVEVSVDEGQTWTEAALEGEGGPGRWQVFRYRFEVNTPGTYQVMARATDTQGNTQPKEANWNPSGYLWNAWHSVTWVVVA
jgi:sulfite oxidase